MKKNYLLLSLVLCISMSYAQNYVKKSGKTEMFERFVKETAQQVDVRELTNLSEGFETYDNFALEFPPWTLVDVDGFDTYGIQDVEFGNMYSPMSFIIFNPSQTTPPMTTNSIMPHSGNKFAACFASDGGTNNDWLISPPLDAGTGTSVSFWVKSYTAEYGLERYRVAVSTTDTDPASFTYISGTNYLTAPAGAWEQRIYDMNAYNGQTIYFGIQCVSDDAFIFMVDDFEFVTTTTETSTLTGKVTDALTGAPLPEATVSVAGLSAITDNQGNYTITNVPSGVLVANFAADITSGESPLTVNFTDQSTENANTVTCSKTGYITYSNNQVVIPSGGSLTLNISLSPTLAAGNMRFVLNWGQFPEDLDSHLNTPVINGQSYHIYYSDQGSATEAPFAQLDHDITTGYGPETMTIYQMFNGTYQYYIYNYSGSPNITNSNAVVQIYDQTGLLYTVQVPTTGIGYYWYVCDVNGSNGQVTIRNVIQTDAPGNVKQEFPAKKYNFVPVGDRSITSWLWDFGDGSTSTLQNPSHTYTTAGAYNISLTVSNGALTDTETKTDFINVTGGGTGNSTLTGRVTDAITGDPVPGSTVTVAGLSAITDNQGNYTIQNVPAGLLVANFNASITTGTAPLNVNFTDQSTENSNTVTCSKTGYITYSNNQVIIPEGGSLTLNISLSPTLAAGNMRFVLNWGATPEDLDSHLNTPPINGQSYHVYYSDEGSATEAPFALLDYDITDGYGPETVTIYQMFPGTYQYFIYNYSGSPQITTSNAVVQIYDQTGLLHTLQVPTVGEGRYWYVCDINGSNGQVTIRNVIQVQQPGVEKYDFPAKDPKPAFPVDRSITSWLWNFGDGATATQQNPAHTYTANGVYTVSLTVSNGTTQSTETKTGFIQVGPQGNNELNFSEKVSVYPIPASQVIQVVSPEVIDLARITDLSGAELRRMDVGESSFRVNIESLKGGVYLLILETQRGKAVKKITIR